MIDHFNIYKGTDYLVYYSPYLQNYLSHLVVLGIILKPSLMVNFRTEHPFCVLSHIVMVCEIILSYIYIYIYIYI